MYTDKFAFDFSHKMYKNEILYSQKTKLTFTIPFGDSAVVTQTANSLKHNELPLPKLISHIVIQLDHFQLTFKPFHFTPHTTK